MIPPILYKFRADDQFTEKIFREKKVWYSSPSQLNDPLECKTGIIPEDWKKKTIEGLEDSQLFGVIGFGALPKTLFSLDERQTKLWLRKFRRADRKSKIREMRLLYRKHGIELSEPQKLFETLQNQLSSVGIFSLTSNAHNHPMWAHYAGNHSGLALGFSASPGSRLADPRHTIEVRYSDEKPTFREGFNHELSVTSKCDGGLLSRTRFSFGDPVLRSAISTKPTSWTYEQEWRCVEESAGSHEFPGELVSLAFGSRMTIERREYYADLIRSAGLEPAIYESVVSPEGTLDLKNLSK